LAPNAERTSSITTSASVRMLTRLIREALFHRDSERRHLAALLISSSPIGSSVTDELASQAGGDHLSGVDARPAATLIRCLSKDSHRLRILAFIHDKSDDVATFVIQGLGHQSNSTTSDQAIRNGLGKFWSPRERAKMYALSMSSSPDLLAIAKAKDAPAWQKAGALVGGAGSGDC
jgi:hypothetical protein